jgi:hypothetical protein
MFCLAEGAEGWVLRPLLEIAASCLGKTIYDTDPDRKVTPGMNSRACRADRFKGGECSFYVQSLFSVFCGGISGDGTYDSFPVARQPLDPAPSDRLFHRWQAMRDSSQLEAQS